MPQVWHSHLGVANATVPVQVVAARLEQRLQSEARRPPMMHVTVEVPLGPAKVSAERDIATPRWLSRWFVEHIELRKHRRFAVPPCHRRALIVT